MLVWWQSDRGMAAVLGGLVCPRATMWLLRRRVATREGGSQMAEVHGLAAVSHTQCTRYTSVSIQRIASPPIVDHPADHGDSAIRNFGPQNPFGLL
jgi:hypothetical protein